MSPEDRPVVDFDNVPVWFWLVVLAGIGFAYFAWRGWQARRRRAMRRQIRDRSRRAAAYERSWKTFWLNPRQRKLPYLPAKETPLD